MQYISVGLRTILIISLFSGIVKGKISSEKPDLTDQTLNAIEDCIDSLPTPWPDEWKKEYLYTIRKTIELHQDASHYVERLEILRNGFRPYWESFKKIDERSLFEVYCARIRWYTENLMVSEFPTDQERQKLHNQYADLWDYATSSLLKQFSFLDPHSVQSAKADDLIMCYRNIEAPLMPVYLKPMTDEHVEKIKQRWNNLRYIRVDLWRQLDHGSSMHAEKSKTPSSNAERDYELTKKSLSQLLGLVWMVVPYRPDYYLSAIEKRNKALKRSFQSERQARLDQQRLEKTHSRQLLQTEHISFLFVALFETMQCIDDPLPIWIQEKGSLEQ